MKEPNKYLFKAAVVVILTVMLLIPTFYVSHLVEERKARKTEVATEIAGNWSKGQVISSPFLQLSYNYAGAKTRAYVMPAKASSSTKAQTEQKKRGIYKIPVYTAAHKIDANFTTVDIGKMQAAYSGVDFTTAKLAISITDAKGIIDSMNAVINGKTFLLTLDESLSSDQSKVLSADVASLFANGPIDFDVTMNLNLRGTEKISFLPLATQNTIQLSSPWGSPAFFGNVISNNNTKVKSGIETTWQVNRFQSQLPSFSNYFPIYKDAVVGVNFIQPVDAYTKTLRVIKYALLLIGLTFAFFFFVEAIKNTPIHPIQYGLVGLAIVIFFVLLLSISEYIGFDMAYLTAGAATILLISWYTQIVTHKISTALTMSGVLLAVYIFMYYIIQLEDTSLLIGSIGLFIALGIIMHLSRKIKWYNATNVKPLLEKLNDV